MQKEINNVKEFHRVFGHTINDKPVKAMTEFTQVLRRKLLNEEVQELEQAMRENNIVEIADAIGDCLYVLFGTALSYGLGDLLPAIFAEIHASNMSKKMGPNEKSQNNEFGKTCKGPNYFKPDIEKILVFGETRDLEADKLRAHAIAYARWLQTHPFETKTVTEAYDIFIAEAKIKTI